MMIIGKQILVEFKAKHADVQPKTDAWIAEVAAANWDTPRDIRQRYASASFLKDNHVVFNLKGNKYRLKVQVNYPNQVVLIKNAGTHDEYNNW